MSPRAVRHVTGFAGSTLFSALIGCGPSAQRAVAPTSGEEPILALRDHKCGKCHTAPEPGTRTRAHLEKAFARHAKRVQLTPAQWQAMTEYLAAAPGASASQVR